MQLTDEQREVIQQQIAAYEAQYDEALQVAYRNQGAAVALRTLLEQAQPAQDHQTQPLSNPPGDD